MKEASDPGLFGPESVTWRLHSHPAALIGGMRALLLQALNPLAMAAVDQHSRYRSDPWGRLDRTTNYILTVTYGTTAEAKAAGAVVRGVHEGVAGTDRASGLPYSASDPELLAWVHNVMVDSVLVAYRAYGGHVSPPDADRYVSEMTRAGELVGLCPDLLPADLYSLRGWLEARLDGLTLSAGAERGMSLMMGPPMPVLLRPLWMLAVEATLCILPQWARSLYGLPRVRPGEPAVWAAAVALSQALSRLRPSPALAAAQRRVRDSGNGRQTS